MLEFDTSDPAVFVKEADFHHETVTGSDAVRFKNTGDSTTGAQVFMHNTRGGNAGVAEDSLGWIYYRGNGTAAGSGDTTYSMFGSTILDPGTVSRASNIDFRVTSNGSLSSIFEIKGSSDGASNASVIIDENADLVLNTGTYDVRVSAETATADRTLTVPDEDGILTTRRRAIAYAMIFGG